MNPRVKISIFLSVLSLVCAVVVALPAVKGAAASVGQLALLVWFSWQAAVAIVRLVVVKFSTPKSTLDKCIIVRGNESELEAFTILKLCSSGFRVFSCLSDKDGTFARSLVQMVQSDKLVICEINKDNKSSFNVCLGRIQRELEGNQRIWGLVNVCGSQSAIDGNHNDYDSHFSKVINANVSGLLHTVRECLPFLRAERGRIVNVMSREGGKGRPAYCAAALSSSTSHSLMECVRREVAYFGIEIINIKTDWQPTAAEFPLTAEDCGSRARTVGNSIEHALRTPFPEFTYQTQTADGKFHWLLSFLPSEVRSRIASLLITE